jgi:PAS domain S-box-containing protein
MGIAFEESPQPMWIFDQLNLGFLAVNTAALQVYGYKREEFLRMTILDIRPCEDIPKVLRNALSPHQITGKSERWRHRTRSGQILQVALVGYPLRFEGRLAQLITVRSYRPGLTLVESHASH